MTLEITFCGLILFQKGVSFLKNFKLKIEIAKKFSVIKTDDVGYQKKREEKTFVGRKINKNSNNNENTKNKQTPTVPTPLPTQKL